MRFIKIKITEKKCVCVCVCVCVRARVCVCLWCSVYCVYSREKFQRQIAIIPPPPPQFSERIYATAPFPQSAQMLGEASPLKVLGIRV